ncbi:MULTISPECIES: trigger factor [unclassified Chelatococcus]|uniref:trigger factor n=1 Tax=unclassified Chelatococcus TaxID=2638111 RepID=UPI001BCC84F5|nr:MULTISPECIES: trigger factor [unclassified Chelatococcus]CAH1672525.1 Trigger factor [Hyphomicrobiales bacterium]MBS7738601.1 trigger factor [Chelatococcus sp. HY11]MBX3543005.1 trigger factor [Chelatococcus sp.]MCO5076869.1 trigger factor [Chelatococcus sp.]CAH1675230.1 Trigger factor [Hyphomicrobiales bacterium]
MQATQTRADGLKREFKVVVPAAELETKLAGELSGLKDRVRINGFRPGKVPMAHLRKLYGRAVMADVVQNTVNEANRKIIEDNSLKLANEPKVTLSEDKDEVEAIMEAKGDLAYTVALEILPAFQLKDLSDIAITRETAEVTDAEVDEALTRMARQNRAFVAKPEGEAAATGDRVTIDFVGTIDGEAFEGGSSEGVQVEIGSGGFIPGFEEQLVGAKAGDDVTVSATFPEEYPAKQLAGKSASFAVKVKDVSSAAEVTVDEDFAKGFGLESLDKLKEAVRSSIERDYTAQSRRKVKKVLLDALDAKYDFELPPSLVEQEFDGVWRQVENDMKQTGRTFADDETTEEEAKAEYQRIAERRVRLGLVLAEIGEQAAVKVADDEVTQAVVERARQFPGQEKLVWDYYRKNPQALAEVRAPIFEEKVVDHILSQVSVTDNVVSREALFADEESESDGDEGKDAKEEGKAAPKKASRAKKKDGA